jgi:hypothetical protein
MSLSKIVQESVSKYHKGGTIYNDLISSHTALIEAEIARKKGMLKTGNNGEGLPFENSPEIYGNQRIEAYKKGWNKAINQDLDYLSRELAEIKKLN